MGYELTDTDWIKSSTAIDLLHFQGHEEESLLWEYICFVKWSFGYTDETTKRLISGLVNIFESQEDLMEAVDKLLLKHNLYQAATKAIENGKSARYAKNMIVKEYREQTECDTSFARFKIDEWFHFDDLGQTVELADNSVRAWKRRIQSDLYKELGPDKSKIPYVKAMRGHKWLAHIGYDDFISIREAKDLIDELFVVSGRRTKPKDVF